MTRDFLTLPDILNIHAELVKIFGGSNGIRTPESVDAALFRPQCGYYEDIFEEAAALLESLLINHPFIDGNKRTAWACCDIFLRINGITLSAESMTIYQYIMSWLAMKPTQRFTAKAIALRKMSAKVN